MSEAPFDLIVIGAGVAGLSAASRATCSGLKVAVVEKSRGVGGRAATRRIANVPVDHGAQFFTVRTQLFQSKVEEWLEAGICSVWTHGLPTWESGLLYEPQDGYPRYVCHEGMTSVSKYEAQGLAVFPEATISECRRESDEWVITSKEGNQWSAPKILVTAPAPQTIALFDQWIDKADPIRTLVYDPCLTGIFEVPGFSPSWKGLRVVHPDISWIAANDTRRKGLQSSVFVVHASPEFSRRHLEENPASAVQRLIPAATEVAGLEFGQAAFIHAHRWRYAQVTNPLPQTHARLSENLVFAGDAFLHANIESAWLSGKAAVEKELIGFG